MVTNVYEKFNYNRLRIDKALEVFRRKSDKRKLRKSSTSPDGANAIFQF